jgi:hypothetical protein
LRKVELKLAPALLLEVVAVVGVVLALLLTACLIPLVADGWSVFRTVGKV